MKKVLVICSHFPPSYNVGANRPRWFARHLPAVGWQPYFITSPRRLLDGPLPREDSDIAGTPVIRITSQLFWKPLAVYHGVRWVRREKIDLIYSTSPNTTVHFIGWLIRLFTNVPWICEFRDPWTLQWVFRNPLRKLWYEFLERQCVRRADHAVTVGHVLKEQFARRGGVPEQKISVVFNGYEKLHPVSAARTRPPQEIRIGYFGTVNLFSSPIPFLRALGALVQRRPELRGRLRFDFVGYFKSCAGLEQEWKEVVRAYDLDGIVYSHGAMSRSDALKILKRSSWLLLVVGGPAGTSELYRSRVPAKLFDCLAQRKPIFTITPAHGETADLVRDAQCGVLVPFSDVKAIEKALEKIADQPEFTVAPSASAQELIRRLSIQWQMKQLSIVLNAVKRTARRPVKRGTRLKKNFLACAFSLAGVIYAPWRAWRRFEWHHAPVKNVLVLASHAGIGNTILLLPMLTALKARWPALRLSVLVRSAASVDLLRAQPSVNDVLHLPLSRGASFREEISLLRQLWADQPRFDCAVSTYLEPHEENALRALLSGARYRISFCPKPFGFLDSHSLREIPGGHEMDNHLRIASLFGAHQRSAPHVRIPDENRATAAAILREQGLWGQPLVGVHPGSDAATAAKRWSLDHFLAVAERVRKIRPDAQFLFFFGPHDEVLRDRFSRQSAPGVHRAKELPLMDSAGLIARCSTFLSNDSGLMHLAAALTVPTVAIFGPTLPAKNAPIGSQHTVIRESLPCSPCYDGRFMREQGEGVVFDPPCEGSLDCLKTIPLERVVEAVLQRLPSPARRPESEPAHA